MSGEGKYYEEVKKKFENTKPESLMHGNRKTKIRAFSYVKDLESCIIRLEKDIELHNGYANIISIAYHELFKVNLSPVKLGVTKHLSVYDHIYNNLKVLPFLILLVVAALGYGSYIYLKHEYDVLQKSHAGTARLVESKKRLNKDISRYDSNIKNTEGKTERIKRIFSMRTESQDAVILHEIAQKLPDDMILTKIEKLLRNKKKSIRITGKCYQEISLLNYIRDLQIKDKRVFLISLTDSRKTKKGKKKDSVFTAISEGSDRLYIPEPGRQFPQIRREGGVNDLNVSNPMPLPRETDRISRLRYAQKPKEVKRLNFEEKMVYYSDTINNTFVLEIK